MCAAFGDTPGTNLVILIGQMVNLLVYRHPLIGAGEIAQADVLLDGRLQLGVGRGAYAYEFERFEKDQARSGDVFRPPALSLYSGGPPGA